MANTFRGAGHRLECGMGRIRGGAGRRCVVHMGSNMFVGTLHGRSRWGILFVFFVKSCKR